MYISSKAYIIARIHLTSTNYHRGSLWYIRWALSKAYTIFRIWFYATCNSPLEIGCCPGNITRRGWLQAYLILLLLCFSFFWGSALCYHVQVVMATNSPIMRLIRWYQHRLYMWSNCSVRYWISAWDLFFDWALTDCPCDLCRLLHLTFDLWQVAYFTVKEQM